MAASRQTRKRPASSKESIGLLAAGSAGSWNIEIDETTAGPDRWFIQIEGPSVQLYFQIPATDGVRKMFRFLTRSRADRAGSTGANGSLAIGMDRRASVMLVRDDEFGDRYFLLVGPENDPVVRLTLAGEDLQQITSALREACEDMDDHA